MDRAKWWNTKELLGNLGELAVSRGFPKSHVFARSRAAFAVAAARSDEVFNPPESYTLWRLPVEIEDQLEDSWARWLEYPDPWKKFLADVDQCSGEGILPALTKLELVSQLTIARTNKLRRAADLRSVPVKIDGESVHQLIEILAAAHSCSEQGRLAVPFIRETEFPK
jgi:hypothetical protein